MSRVRYAQVGLGIRSWMYSHALCRSHRDAAELVGLCDSNPGRLADRVDWCRELGTGAPGYAAADFDRLLAEVRPDQVIVTSPDATHDDYVCRALEAGCDVVTEKPLTIDERRLARILETRERTDRRVRVTFNYRYSPPRTQVRQLLREGVVGEVLSVDFHWHLDTTHGADYFRRWHRERRCSGGLLVHKATHHFDLMNWWLDSRPSRVQAAGGLDFYTPARADALGLADRGDRCLDCAAAERCPFRLPLRGDPILERLYLRHEEHDGYHRDRCVFSPEIDIEDHVGLVVEYASGATLSYSLAAFLPEEGYEVVFNGSRGRLEHRCRESGYVSGRRGDGDAEPGRIQADETRTRVVPHAGAPWEVEIPAAEGGHGGGDRLLLDDLFAAEPPPDPHGRRADHVDGAWSVLTGIAANASIRDRRPVAVEGLLPPGLLADRETEND